MRQAYFFVIFVCYGALSGPAYVNGEDCKNGSHNVTSTTKPPCSEEKLVNFLAEIQVINPESIVEWAVDNFEPLCRKVCRNLKKIDTYFTYCNPPQENDLYMALISGVKTLRDKVCSESDFVKRYVTYYPCLHELKNDFEGCNGPADWNEDPDRNELCKSYKNVVDCYYIKAAKVCGYESAKTLKELMRDVIDHVVRVKCSGISHDPYVADPMPESYIKRSGACAIHISRRVIAVTVFLMLYRYQSLGILR